MNEKVAVLMGGTSAEREPSLNSGKAVHAALLEAGFDAHAIDTQVSSILSLKEQGFTKAFIAVLGRGGEDGTLQAILEYLNIPYTGSGVRASAIAMSKLHTKWIWKSNGLPMGQFVWLSRRMKDAGLDDETNAAIKALGMPIFVKPSNEGSSIGVSRVDSLDLLPAAIEEAFRHDDDVLVEAFLGGQEYTVGILGDQILPSIRIQTAHFYDYNAKYNSDETKYFCPSGLSAERETEIQTLVMKAWRVLGCSGWGRVDVMTDSQGNFHLLEVNTAPGMTSHSLLPMAAKKAGFTFPQLVTRILELINDRSYLLVFFA